jgi:hypothetical protein
MGHRRRSLEGDIDSKNCRTHKNAKQEQVVTFAFFAEKSPKMTLIFWNS